MDKRHSGEAIAANPLEQQIIQRDMTFTRDGAERYHAAIDGDTLDRIKATLPRLPSDKAGIRLQGNVALSFYLQGDGAIGSVVRRVLESAAKPVRAVLFDKTLLKNWKLGWHQDRTIAVRRRVDQEGYGPWSVKSGLQHVTPPFDVLSRMVTLRAHLDPVGYANAPLLVSPGSHRLGRVAESDIQYAVEKCGNSVCLAEAGDIWLYSTSILHASDRAMAPMRRRVLQVDYSADELPGELEWLGV